MYWKYLTSLFLAVMLTGIFSSIFWYWRGPLIKPIILSIQIMQDRNSTDPHWYQDDYTEPNTRCVGTLVTAGWDTGWCQADAERIIPCEQKIMNFCNIIYP